MTVYLVQDVVRNYSISFFYSSYINNIILFYVFIEIIFVIFIERILITDVIEKIRLNKIKKSIYIRLYFTYFIYNIGFPNQKLFS